MCPQITGAMVRGQPVRTNPLTILCSVGIKLRLLGLKASVFTGWAILVAQGQISKERTEPMSVDLYMRHLSLSPPPPHIKVLKHSGIGSASVNEGVSNLISKQFYHLFTMLHNR